MAGWWLFNLFCSLAIAVEMASWLHMAVGSRISLVSIPPLEGCQCPGHVRITCTADRLVTVFWWINNDPMPIARYTKPAVYTTVFPVNMTTVDSLHLGWIVLLTNSLPYDNHRSNYTTIVETTIAHLLTSSNTTVTKIWCGYNSINASLNVSLSVIGPPPPPTDVMCSLAALGESQVIVTLLLVQFMEKYNISHYRIDIAPNHSTSCAGNFNTTNYSCNRLLVGNNYTLSLRGFNCFNQEGGLDNIIIHPQVPGTPRLLSVVALYDDTSHLIKVDISWTEQLLPPVSNRCSYSLKIYYEVVLTSLSTQDQLKVVVSNDSCTDLTCSASLYISSRDSVIYNVSIKARNTFGYSRTSHHESLIDVCNLTCQNGVCTDMHICDCHEGWNGTTCSQAICDPGFCLNGGRCLYSNIRCTCLANYTGFRCETKRGQDIKIKTVVITDDSLPMITIPVVSSVVLTLLIVCLLLLLVTVIFKCKQRRKLKRRLEKRMRMEKNDAYGAAAVIIEQPNIASAAVNEEQGVSIKPDYAEIQNVLKNTKKIGIQVQYEDMDV